MIADTLQIGTGNVPGAVRVLRMIADDLTGAVDTAVKFAGRGAPVRVAWGDELQVALAAPCVFDTGCRDMNASAAAAKFASALPLLAPSPDAISFLKLDSLLRGNAGAEIAACARSWPDRAIIVAPALPEQHRITRGGRQFVVRGDRSEIVGEGIAASVQAAGIPVTLRRPGEQMSTGVNLVDAETDGDLDRIVDANISIAPLWCGSAGLGKALARATGTAGHSAPTALAAPVLGIFGSDHHVLARQLAAVRQHVIAVTESTTSLPRIVAALRLSQVALATFPLLNDVSRVVARMQIEQRVIGLLEGLSRPATLIVSGGETLRTVCAALGGAALDVYGEVDAGVPMSRLCGGRWHGVSVVSKSGAFGADDCLARLLAGIETEQQETTA